MQKTGVITRFKVNARAHVAAFRYRRPTRKMRVVLVVGQDGGVGTAAYLASILRADGQKVGVITGQYVEIADRRAEGSDQADVHGDTFRLQALLAQMRKAKCKYAIIDVPAELPAHQFVGIKPAMVIVRRCGDNYTDQMTMKAHLAMLGRVLARKPQFVVINRDDPCSADLAYLSGHPGVISFGTHKKAECKIARVQMHPKGCAIDLLVDHQTDIALVTEQTGNQAIYNAVAAAASAYILHVPIEAIEQGIARQSVVPGLCEYVPAQRPYQIVLDGANTPAGLAETLESLKHFAKNRLLVLLSVPLGTSQTTLPVLGEIAARAADRVVLCDGEFAEQQSAQQIRELLMQGIAAAGGEAKTDEIVDRRDAIQKVLSIARRGDLVVLAAITQRPYRQLGVERVEWNDRRVVEEIIG